MSDESGNGAAHFQPTRWSLVIAAVHQSPEALAAFCRDYWGPVYAHLRRRGLSPEDAADRTQDVFARLTQPNAMEGISAERGRFRTFMLACAENEVSRWRKGLAAQRRGGGTPLFSLDRVEAESRFAAEAVCPSDPVAAYDQSFALGLLGRVLELLQREYRQTQQTEMFVLLRPLLTDPPEHGELAGLAGHLGMTEGNLRVCWHRLRRRFSGLLLEEVAQTVADPKDTRDELSHLLAAFATPPASPLDSCGPQ